MKTEKTIKILGLANLSQLKKGEDAVGYGKPILSKEEALKLLDKGQAPAAKGYKAKSAFTRPQKNQEPTLEQVKAAIEVADNQRSTKQLHKIHTELTEAKAKSVKEEQRRAAQLALVTIPAAFLGREGNLLSEAEVINRLGQPMRDHAKVIAALKIELEDLKNLPSFKEQAKILQEFKAAKGKPSDQLIAKAKANVAVCKQATAEVNARLNVAYAQGDFIAAEADTMIAATKVEYAAFQKAANAALKGENLRDVVHAHQLASKGVTRHDESLQLIADAIKRIEAGERLLQTKLATGSLEELLALYDAPAEPETEETPIGHETDNAELATAVAADPNTVLDIIDNYFLMEIDDKFIVKPGLEAFVDEKGKISVLGEHAEVILMDYKASKTAEVQMPPVTPPVADKKTRAKNPVKGVKVANATPNKRKSKNA